MKFEIDMDLVIEQALSFESYFVLMCLYQKDRDTLKRYRQTFGQIDTASITDLVEKGLIVAPDKREYTFSELGLTDKFYSDFVGLNGSIEFEVAFAELREKYPKSVKDAFGKKRTVQLDIARCNKLYKAALLKGDKVDLTVHREALRGVVNYVKELENSQKLGFIKALPTFLQQRTWENFQDEVEEEGGFITDI